MRPTAETLEAVPERVRALATTAVRTKRYFGRRRAHVRTVRALSLVFADLCAFASSVVVAFLVGSTLSVILFDGPGPLDTGGARQLAIVFGPALAVLLWRSWAAGDYTRFRPLWTEIHGLLRTVAIIAALAAFTLFALKSHFSRLWFTLFLVGLAGMVPWARRAARGVLVSRGLWFRPTWIVGCGTDARRLVEAIESDVALGHRVVGFVDLSCRTEPSARGELDGRALRTSLPDSDPVHELALVFAPESFDEPARHRAALDAHVATNAAVSIAPPPLALPLHGAEMIGIFRHDATLLRLQNGLSSARARLLKRGFDLLVAGAALVILSPAAALIALLVARDGGPVLFRHRRVGRTGIGFDCLKFRTMQRDGEAALEAHLSDSAAAAAEWRATRKLRRDPRLTGIGRRLRRSSLDELPQLWNVVRGEMSLIGPRPIVEAECARYGDRIDDYLDARPGITGLWQVSGRSDTSYERRVELDVWYARNWSLWNDFVILVQTVPVLLGRRGAY